MTTTIARRIVSICVLLLALPYAVTGAAQQQSAPEVITTGGAGARIHAAANSSRNGVVFRVRNSGVAAATYELACSVTGALSSCLASDSVVEVQPGEFVRVGVRYTSGGNGSGRVTLTATLKPATGGVVQNSADYDVLILAPESSAEMPLKVHGPRADAGTDGITGEEFSLYGVSNPPFMIISPSGGSFTSSQLDVMIEWCSWGYQLLPSTRAIDFNSVNVTTSFSYVNTPFECAQYAGLSLGQVTLVSGTNTLNTVIKSGYGLGYGSAQYSYIPPGTPGAPTVDISPNPNGRLVRSACVTSGAGPAGVFQCGDLLIAHSMPAFRTFDRDRTMTLLYNSATAKPYSIVMADVSLAQGVSAPDRFDVTLIVNGVQQASHSFSAAGFASGGNARRLAVGFDPVTAGLATGAYSYTLHVTSVYGGQSFPVSKAGQLIVINRQSSPYGAGWAVGGVERLFAQSDGSRLLVDGDGSAWLYTSIGSNQWRAPAGAYRDTLFLGAVSNGSVPAGTYYWRYDLSGTRTFYDLDGRQVFVVDRLQNKVEYSYLPTGPEARLDKVVVAPHNAQHRYEFTYDGNGRLASINDPSGSRTLYTTINASNDLAAIRDPGYAVGKEIQFTYDSHRLKTRRSRRGHTTRYGYHNAYFGSTGVLRADTLPVAVVNQAFTPIQIRGLASQAAANSTVRSDSAFVTIRGVRNDTARFLVNSDYAPTLIIDPLSTVSTLAYDPNHPLLVTRIAQPAHGIVRRMGYDAIGRLSWLQDSTHSQGPARTDYIYGSQIRDNPSHVISDRTTTDRDTIRYFFDPSTGWADSVRDARGKSTKFAYFPNGKVQTITNALGKSTNFTYTGAANLETVTTPLGHVTEYTYDIYGQVRTQLAPATGLFTIYRGVRSNQPESTAFVSATYGNLTTQFTYDDDGNLITRVDPNNIARQWEYDPLGNMKKMTDESGHAENRVHTADGLPLIITNRDGSQVLQDYNAAGQVTMRYLHPAQNYGGPYDEIEMEYDALGRIERIENTNSRITRTYRPEGTLATEEQYLKFSEANGKTFKYEYIYNKGGARTQAKIFINGVLQRTITYSRGKDNLLGGMTWGAHSLSIGYDDLGRRATLSFPGGINVSLSYDDDGRFTRLLTASLDLEFTSFDGAGRPLSATRTGNTSILWTYDLQGQITSMTDLGVTASYVYDKAGNRIRESLNGTPYLYTYFPGTNRLQKRCEATSNWLCKTSGQWQQYAYNANGDITTKQTHNGLNIPFFRTADGQITSHNAYATQFRYDGLGRLVMRRDGDTFNQTTGYDGVNVGWHNGAFFLHGDGADDPLVTSTGGNCFFVTDNARLLAYLGGAGCDSNWDMMGRYAGAINQSWGFGLNREHEANSQLSFFRNRWYDAQTGRFTQEDPIGFAGGLNLYAYAGNNPASYTDPFGLCPSCAFMVNQAAAEIADGPDTGELTSAPGPGEVIGLFVGGGFAFRDLAGRAGRGLISKFVSREVAGNITPKIARQMGTRGWTNESIQNVLNSPHAKRAATNRATGNKASAYFNRDGSYVVRDNVTGDIVQVSNRLDPNWIPDSSIRNPYRP